MEAAIAAAVAGLANLFGSLSTNRAIGKQTELEQERTDQLFQQGLWASIVSNNQTRMSSRNTTVIFVSVIFIAVIAAIVLLKKKK